MDIQVPPGFTQEEFEKLLEDHIAQSMFDAIITYLKGTADVMDQNGLEYLTSTDLRRLALEMATQGYEPQ
jgi:hypothetical protein